MMDRLRLISSHADTALCSQVRAVSKDWASRADLPSHVADMIASFPSTMHPMTQLVAAVTALQMESKFAKAYNEKSVNKVGATRLMTLPEPPRVPVLPPTCDASTRLQLCGQPLITSPFCLPSLEPILGACLRGQR